MINHKIFEASAERAERKSDNHPHKVWIDNNTTFYREYDLTRAKDVVRYIARQRYAWPGGYLLFVVCPSGDMLCSECVRKEYKDLLEEINSDTGYGVVGEYALTSAADMDNGICQHCEPREWYAQETCIEFDNCNINTDIACDCPTCVQTFGFDQREDESSEDFRERFKEAISEQEVIDEGSFSHSGCDCCGSNLGGDRYAAHGFKDDEIYHLDICQDCLMWLANGEPFPKDGE